MKLRAPISLAWIRFASCSGCQLMLANCESSLTALAQSVEVRNFPLLSSARDKGEAIDLGLVEGSVTTPSEVEQLLAFRRRVHLLVAIGACALTGGINTLVKGERLKAIEEIYSGHGQEWDTFPPQAVHHFVKVDGRIPGCPPEQSELLCSIGALLQGGWSGHQVMPVCMECRINENRCLLEKDHAPCLGPVTLAGCNAKCPNLGVPCEGCRGVVPEANRDELCRLFITAGLSELEIRHRLERFGESHYDQVDR